MKEIPLTQGKVALVDDEDYARAAQFKWCAAQGPNTWYAHRGVNIDGHWTTQKLHRFILGLVDSSIDIDHEDHDGLNCQKANLRTCNASQNRGNSRKPVTGLTPYKGVTWHKQRGKWRAQIGMGGKVKHLGLFTDEREAAAAYDEAARKHYGMFAQLNNA